jgi:hypothetical protein
LSGNRRVVFLLLAVGLGALLVSSCGEDTGGGPRCSNCDFWTKVFGGIAHYPEASPVADSRLVAFTSTPTREALGGDYDHVWVAELAEGEGDTTRFYHITTGEVYDAKPAWSPDGRTLAFERQGGGVTEIYTVDVADPASPGTPVRFTAPTTEFASFESPGWTVIGQDTFIVFSGSTKGKADFDVLMKRFPAGGGLVQVTIDPADYARDENGVLSAVFKDQQTSGNGGRLVAFASQDRVRVGDIRVRARSVEKPDTTEAADIWINGKDSGKETPYLFRYRPAGTSKIEIRGKNVRYCTDPFDSIIPQPGTETALVLDFVYRQGTVGFSSNPGVQLVYFDGRVLEGLRTPGFPTEYVYIDCVGLGAHAAYAANIITRVQCSPTYQFTVTAGETTLVSLDCTGGGGLLGAPAAVRPTSAPRAALPLTAGPNGLWLLDLPEAGPMTDASVYLVASSNQVISQPAISPDGKYVAYLRGQGKSREIIVSDVSGLLAGGGEPEGLVIGMPGSLEDIECWRIPERVTWLPGTDGRRILASFSVCRGGARTDFEVWIADLDRFIP